jgi:hypothetical protein
MIDTLKSIDDQNFPFEIKILSLDDFGEAIDQEVKRYTEMNNWKLLISKREGMVKNQLRALNLVQTEWVFYCEDDVIVEKIPTSKKIELLIDAKPNTGIISFTGGGYDAYNSSNYEKIIKNLQNDIFESGKDEIFWLRDSNLANEWYFEFPTMMVKTDILKQCIDTSLKYFKNLQIEKSYTKSYFYLNFHKSYEKYTWSRDFRQKLDLNKNINEILNEIANNYVYIKHNRNEAQPSVGSGYNV